MNGFGALWSLLDSLILIFVIFIHVFLVFGLCEIGCLFFVDFVWWIDFRDKSVSGHSVTLRETIAVSSAEINGATAFEVSGMMGLCCNHVL